eukprot:m51a1_g7501 hypothetical protein (220) ;mRNA; f:275788-276447
MGDEGARALAVLEEGLASAGVGLREVVAILEDLCSDANVAETETTLPELISRPWAHCRGACPVAAAAAARALGLPPEGSWEQLWLDRSLWRDTFRGLQSSLESRDALGDADAAPEAHVQPPEHSDDAAGRPSLDVDGVVRQTLQEALTAVEKGISRFKDSAAPQILWKHQRELTVDLEGLQAQDAAPPTPAAHEELDAQWEGTASTSAAPLIAPDTQTN